MNKRQMCQQGNYLLLCNTRGNTACAAVAVFGSSAVTAGWSFVSKPHAQLCAHMNAPPCRFPNQKCFWILSGCRLTRQHKNAPTASSLAGLVTDWLVLEPDRCPLVSWHTFACLCCNAVCLCTCTCKHDGYVMCFGAGSRNEQEFPGSLDAVLTRW